MLLIVWLGNPGRQYAHTRHNAGFLAVETLAQEIGSTPWKEEKKFLAELSTGELLGEKALLLKPTTYMNLSGDSVQKVASFYRLDATRDIIVISDDIDMEYWKVRYRKSGSAGGQNGLKSIALCLWTEEYARIKIGIGRSPHMNAADWVLSKFSSEEKQLLTETILPEAMKKISEWAKGRVQSS